MNYKQKIIVADKILAEHFPQIRSYKKSGIYLYTRTDEKGITFFYVGQAKNIYNRAISHHNGYSSRIDRSLKKRKYYSITNPHGWKFEVLEFCPVEELDEKESKCIFDYMQKCMQTYNETYGGQGEGKEQIKGSRQRKGYRDGIEQGYKNAQKEISNLFEKHLNYSKKSDKPNKNQDKAIEKFKDFLNFEKGVTNADD